MFQVPVFALEDVEDGGDDVIRPERGQELSPVCSAANSQLILSEPWQHRSALPRLAQPVPSSLGSLDRQGRPPQLRWQAGAGRRGSPVCLSVCGTYEIWIYNLHLHAMRDENRVVCVCSQAQVHTCHGLMIRCLNNESKSECINIRIVTLLNVSF